MTNSSALKCTVSPGPTSPTLAARNTVTADGSRQKKCSRSPSGPPPSTRSKKARWPSSSRHCRRWWRWQSATRRSPANAIDRVSMWCRSDEPGSGLDWSPWCLGIRIVTALANRQAVRVSISVMALVFSWRPSNRCPKSIVSVVLATVGVPSGVSDARSVQSRVGGSGRAVQNCNIASRQEALDALWTAEAAELGWR